MGKRYRLTFGASKTKVTVTGSRRDMSYYKDINIWTMDGKQLEVADNNEHLGLVVSGHDEEIKNIDKNIGSARKILFSLLGSIFSYRCKLSQLVLHHVWTLYVNPALRSGLAALPIRPSTVKTLTRFHHKILRGILKLSSSSPIPALYFLLGEIPIESALHIDLLTLFWCVWSNPQTKVYEIVKYLLMMSNSSSLTWAAHLKLLCQMYDLPNPLKLLNGELWPKEKWKLLVKSRVTVHTEAKWRAKAASNSKLSFLNPQISGLIGRPHPVLSGILTTQEVVRSRVHIRMLAGDYPCYAYIGTDQNKDPTCRLCQSQSQEQQTPPEDMVHLLASCKATAGTRARVIPELLNTIAYYYPDNALLNNPSHSYLTQLILDPTSLNLPLNIRISPDYPGLQKVLEMCRTVCFAIHKDRIRKLKTLSLK